MKFSSVLRASSPAVQFFLREGKLPCLPSAFLGHQRDCVTTSLRTASQGNSLRTLGPSGDLSNIGIYLHIVLGADQTKYQ